MCIEIHYFEDGVVPSLLLGSEKFSQIEEVLLPTSPVPNRPVFMTKKFTGRNEYRWQVTGVDNLQHQPNTLTVFHVFLKIRRQIEKNACLTNIMKNKGNLQTILLRGNVVEVEYGHPMSIAKLSDVGFKSSKRYPDSMQSGSMPKRRLAVVLRAVSTGKGKGLVQVVPISSAEPQKGDRLSSVEITTELHRLKTDDYQKASWVICNMVETVSPTRIFAANIRFAQYRVDRDTGFRSQISKTTMALIDQALLHGVTLQDLLTAKNRELVDLAAQVNQLKVDLQCAIEDQKFLEFLDASLGGIEDFRAEFQEKQDA